MAPSIFSRGDIEQLIIMVRLNLYNRVSLCGPQPIRQALDHYGVRPLPSLNTIKRILSRNGLTHGRTGLYPLPLRPPIPPGYFISIKKPKNTMTLFEKLPLIQSPSGQIILPFHP